MKNCDVLIIGGGIMGAATAWQAALRSRSVVCLEAGRPTHSRGSSHGASRIFRQAYWEGEKYLPLLRLADEGWRHLQESCGESLLSLSGGIFIGCDDNPVVKGSLKTARLEKVPHQLLNAEDLRSRFPQFQVGGHMCGIHESGAYAISADASRLQMLNEAVRLGASLCFGETAVQIQTSGNRLRVSTNRNNVWDASAVVVCAGPWMPGLLPELAPYLRPVRMPIYWFIPRPGQGEPFAADRFPVFLYELDGGGVLYGLPDEAGGQPALKIGFHNRQQLAADPDSNPPAVDERRIQEIGGAVCAVLPGLYPLPVAARWCFYTMSSDESFLIGRSASHQNLWYVSACSGHGFKFAPGIGRVVSELAVGAPPSASLDPFGSDRFAGICR